MYLANQWNRLTNYVEDGSYPIDNNAAEAFNTPIYDRQEKLALCKKSGWRTCQCKYL
ncbi:IS66 family transposase [Teredinibacter purpureus]|uniref:IS66 family transposase n=1 Tax=Teredinibacter purpureus TaxID=2731756 RepID=UPI0022874D76|nr:transposase [Teredinibacter purpureus]